MGYFGMTYFDSLMHQDQAKRRDLDGQSVSKEKGTDGKANNTSEYNHDYYMKNKEKWSKEDSNSDDSNKTSDDGDNANGKSLSADPNFDLDAAALDVIRGKYGNGQARRDALGEDYAMIQRRVDEMYREGKFGGSSASETPKDENSNKSTGSSSSLWFNEYKDRIAKGKQKTADKEAAKKAQEEQQKSAEAADKKKNKK